MSTLNLRESELRPDELMKRQKIRMLCDVGRLLSRRKEFVSVACPACESHVCHKIFTKYGLEYYTCEHCGTVYMTPRPSPEVLEWFYRNSENYDYWSKHIFPASENVRRAKIFAPRVERVLEYCDRFGIQTKRLMEVGAAFGTFCTEMETHKRFQRIVAVEPTPDLANVCRKKGLETIEKPIEQVFFCENNCFDVVVSFEVIEHLFSPHDFIQKCAGLLTKGGLLVLTCPNGKGFDFVTLGEKCIAVDHEHLNYFNPTSLEKLLGACGLDVLEITTPGRLDAELVRNKIIDGEFDVEQQPFLKQVLIDNWEIAGQSFQTFLAQNKLSSHMWVIAQRK